MLQQVAHFEHGKSVHIGGFFLAIPVQEIECKTLTLYSAKRNPGRRRAGVVRSGVSPKTAGFRRREVERRGSVSVGVSR